MDLTKWPSGFSSMRLSLQMAPGSPSSISSTPRRTPIVMRSAHRPSAMLESFRSAAADDTIVVAAHRPLLPPAGPGCVTADASSGAEASTHSPTAEQQGGGLWQAAADKASVRIDIEAAPRRASNVGEAFNPFFEPRSGSVLHSD